MTERRGMDWRLVALVYALIAAAFIARAIFTAGTTPLLADTDDAMRMTVVHDLLAGQGWYDNIQHRLNAPYGAELHWSRLADLPLAGLLLILRPVFGATLADTIGAFAVPLILLAVLLYLSGRITLKLVGHEGLLPALLLPAFSLTVLTEFAPGRIDHHSIQILLLLAMLWCAIEALARPRFAIGAGLAAATSIAIGVEGIPGVAAAILAFGLMWVTGPARAPALRSFGLSFALGTILHQAIGIAPGRWLTPACDAISFTYVVAACAVGAAFVLLSFLPLGNRSRWLRLVAGLAAGVALALVLGLAFPDCLRGPYSALDPWLTEHWLNRISEAEPLWTSLLSDPVYPLAVAVPSLAALAFAAWRVWRGPREGRGEWWIYTAFLALSIATMLVQIRASRMATPVAVPAGAALIVAARHWYLAQKRLPQIGTLILAWIGSAGLGVALIVIVVEAFIPGYAESSADPDLQARRDCIMPDAFRDLAAMPPERIMTPIDLGSYILAFTPHSVVAAPYHRNQQGVRDAFEFFNGPIAAALQILEQRRVTLVVICPSLPELRGLPDAAADSFVRLYAKGQLPAWLVDVTPPGAALKTYAVTP
jgi:hypothetical protein